MKPKILKHGVRKFDGSLKMIQCPECGAYDCVPMKEKKDSIIYRCIACECEFKIGNI